MPYSMIKREEAVAPKPVASTSTQTQQTIIKSTSSLSSTPITTTATTPTVQPTGPLPTSPFARPETTPEGYTKVEPTPTPSPTPQPAPTPSPLPASIFARAEETTEGFIKTEPTPEPTLPIGRSDTPTQEIRAETTQPIPEQVKPSRAEDYSLKGYIEPTLEAVKRDPAAQRLSDIIYQAGQRAEANPALATQAQLLRQPKPSSVYEVAGGVVEGVERTGELVFPFPKPRPAEPSIPFTSPVSRNAINKALGTPQLSSMYMPNQVGLARSEPKTSEVPTASRMTGILVAAYLQGKVLDYILHGGPETTRLKGAREQEVVKTTDTTAQSKRLTTLQTEQESISRADAKSLKEMERYFTPEEIRMGGTEDVVQRGGGEFDVYGRQVEAVRPAEPFVSAAKGQTTISSKVVQVGEDTATRVIATQPGQVYQEVTIARSGGVIGPPEALIQRRFSAVQLYGKIDPQVYLKLTKSVPPDVAQSWYAQMGGVPRTILEQNVKQMAGVQLTTTLVGVTIPESTVMESAILIPTIVRLAPTAPTAKSTKIPTPQAIQVQPQPTPPEMQQPTVLRTPSRIRQKPIPMEPFANVPTTTTPEVIGIPTIVDVGKPEETVAPIPIIDRYPKIIQRGEPTSMLDVGGGPLQVQAPIIPLLELGGGPATVVVPKFPVPTEGEGTPIKALETFGLPSGLAGVEPRGKGRRGRFIGTRKYLWEFPVVEPRKIMQTDFLEKKRR